MPKSSFYILPEKGALRVYFGNTYTFLKSLFIIIYNTLVIQLSDCDNVHVVNKPIQWKSLSSTTASYVNYVINIKVEH